MPVEAAPSPPQRPCIHCGDCVRVCPVGLDPQALFFALVGEDWPAVQRGRLDTCTECRRCEEACPSHIPLLDWLRWGKAEQHRQRLLRERADLARTRHEARNARLARERLGRERQRAGTSPDAHAPAAAIGRDPGSTISKAEVMAAIARARARRASRTPKTPHADEDAP